MENELTKLEKEIESLINNNVEIIKRIEKNRSNNSIELTKYFYEVKRPELNCRANEHEPYTFSVNEETKTTKISDFVKDWIIPSTEEKPIDVDPDKTLYGKNDDLMNSKCENFDDLIRWNSQEIVCKKYLNFLRESISMKFGLLFKKNFEIVKKLLKLLEYEISFECEKSNFEEIEVKIKDINRQISNLFEIKGVCNRFSGEIPSTILTDQMKTSLGKMLDKKIFKFVLIHDQTRGQSGADFDKAVKGVGPTLIVIKSTTGYIFGAYVHDTFGAPGSWIKGSEETFIFTFRNNNTPVKLLHNGIGQGIHITNCGLHLSSDLVAFCSYSCNPSVYIKIAPGYDTSLAVNNTLIAGSCAYTPQHMEVFSVSSV